MIEIRPEQPADAEAIHDVNAQAFGRVEEAVLIDILRKRGAVTLSLVAVEGKQVVGHVLFTPITIESQHSHAPALGLGPVAVLPSHQRKGIGSALISTGLEHCRSAGHDAVVVLGSPDYYPRFGFVQAHLCGIRFEQDVPQEVFMVLELQPGALAGRTGIARYQPEFLSV